VEGVARFLRRLWAFGYELKSAAASAPASAPQLDPQWAAVRREIHANLRQADYDMSRHQFNTVVSAAMKMLNALERAPKAASAARAFVLTEGFGILLRVLAPITPHVCHVLWQALGYGEDILGAGWPEADARALVEDEVELVVQVNGKLRGNIRVAKDAAREVIEAAALGNPTVQRFLQAKAPKKIVVVPGRLVNLVV
jgi:leucyl-tRNA synthetase